MLAGGRISLLYGERDRRACRWQLLPAQSRSRRRAAPRLPGPVRPRLTGMTSPVPTLHDPSTRFDRLPAWQRAAVLSLTALVICLVLLLGAEAAVRIRNLTLHGNFWGIDETYEIDRATGLRI